MYGYGILRCAERPHVQVVHGLDAVDRGDGLSHLSDIYVIGYAVESQAHACAQQPPCRDKYNGSNRNGYQRVYDVPSRTGYYYARYQYAYRHERIGNHVQVCALYVEILLAVLHEEPCGEGVDYDPDACDPRHDAAVDGLRVEQTLDALPDDSSYGGYEYAGIDE